MCRARAGSELLVRYFHCRRARHIRSRLRQLDLIASTPLPSHPIAKVGWRPRRSSVWRSDTMLYPMPLCQRHRDWSIRRVRWGVTQETQSTQAKTRVAQILRGVEQRKAFAITPHGSVVAHLNSALERGRSERCPAVDRFRERHATWTASGKGRDEMLEARLLGIDSEQTRAGTLAP